MVKLYVHLIKKRITQLNFVTVVQTRAPQHVLDNQLRDANGRPYGNRLSLPRSMPVSIYLNELSNV